MSNIWKYRSDERREGRPRLGAICIDIQDALHQHLVKSCRFSPVQPNLQALLCDLPAETSSKCWRTPSSCPPLCAWTGATPPPISPDVNTSNPARLRAAARRTHTLLFESLSGLLVCRLYVQIFHFIQGSDLKSCSLLLEEAPVWDLTLQRRRGVSSDLTLYVPFCSFPLVLSGALLQSSRFLLSRYLLQLLQENPRVFQGSSSSTS